MKIWKVKHFACFQRSCRVSVFIDLVLFLVSDIFPVLMALNIMKSLNLNKWIICFTFSRERELPPAALHSCLLIFSDFSFIFLPSHFLTFAGLHENNEELQAQMLNKGLEEGRTLLMNQAHNNSLAAEFEAMSENEVSPSFDFKEN